MLLSLQEKNTGWLGEIQSTPLSLQNYYLNESAAENSMEPTVSMHEDTYSRVAIVAPQNAVQFQSFPQADTSSLVSLPCFVLYFSMSLLTGTGLLLATRLTNYMCIVNIQHLKECQASARLASYPLLPSIVPRPLPRFYLAAMEKNLFLHGCETKSGQRPGNEATSSQVSQVVMHAYANPPLSFIDNLPSMLSARYWSEGSTFKASRNR